jgi:hypothetical protein
MFDFLFQDLFVLGLSIVEMDAKIQREGGWGMPVSSTAHRLMHGIFVRPRPDLYAYDRLVLAERSGGGCTQQRRQRNKPTRLDVHRHLPGRRLVGGREANLSVAQDDAHDMWLGMGPCFARGSVHRVVVVGSVVVVVVVVEQIFFFLFFALFYCDPGEMNCALR